MIDINLELARKTIENFIADDIRKSGLKGGVLGLSGGLDSSIVATLAVAVLGKENVLGLILPYRKSSPESKGHALLLADQLGIKTVEFDISNMADGYDEEMSKIRLGNLLARIRMSIIFDQSQKNSYMVLGTSNKTEFLIGYTTWYGDSAAGMYPIGDLYKTQVRALSRYVGVPEEIISKSPSADLWQGQTDEGEIGFTYEKLDDILFRFVDKKMKPEDIVLSGFDRDEVSTIVSMVKKTQFKRIMPPICKLSGRTIGVDFDYIREW